MFHSAGIILALLSPQAAPTQVAPTQVAQAIATPEEMAIVFSGPQFAIALIAGVVLAFAFQLLLTEFVLAAGISSMEFHDGESGGVGTMRHIGGKLGFWTLISVCIALGGACWLAAKLSLISSLMLGAIFGLVVWGTYFCLVFWVGSTTVGSLIGSIVKTATAGFQSLAGTATAALGARTVNAQVVSTVEASVDAVRHELAAALDPEDMRERIEDYFAKLRPQELDLSSARSQLEKFFQNSDLQEMAQSGNLPAIDRQTFVNLLGDRSDFSKRDINRIADMLEDAWKQATSQMPQSNALADFTHYLQSANPDELRKDFNSRLDRLISSFQSSSNGQKPNVMAQAGQLGIGGLVSIAMGRSDLSDFDVEKIVTQLRSVGDRLSEQANKIASDAGLKEPEPFNTIRADVENYLNNTYSWQMTPENIQEKFKQVIYDPEADPAKVRRQLEQISREDFVKILSDRGVFTQDKLEQIADDLEKVRQEVFNTVRTAAEQQKSQELRSQVENYLRSSDKERLNPEAISRTFKALLEDPDTGIDMLRARLFQFNRETLVQMLSQRQDISQDEAQRIAGDLLNARDRVLSQAQELTNRAKSQLTELRQKIEDYLRSTGKEELNPEGIERDLKTLLEDPQAGLNAMRARLSDFDRDTLVQLLAQRQDLSPEQIEQVIDRLQSMWQSVLHAPQTLGDRTKEQYDRVTHSIAEYLRSTGKEELNPDAIQQDLAKLLEDPKEGALALRDRLWQIDRDTIVQLLAQRQDLSEEEINQLVDRVQESIRAVVKAPRRFAKRVQTQAMDFKAAFEDYLRSTGKEELNPDAIERDLKQLLDDPKAGAVSLRDRLSLFDRETIVALLSQREDISEEEANRLVDRFLSVRDRLAQQLHEVQDRMQQAVDGMLGNLRNYLNSLNRPELNYDAIKEDMRKLFDDPEAGYEALLHRLSQFNRDTLVAILSSREDISEADANRIVDRIDSARQSVLHRAERLQQKVQERMESLKHKALEQAEETRSAAASAAWWLFGTALTSAAVSAFAGMMGVSSWGF